MPAFVICLSHLQSCLPYLFIRKTESNPTMGVMRNFTDVAQLGWLQLSALALTLLLGWILFTIIYNLFFHPLRNIPGPLLHRATIIPWSIQILRGTQMFATQKMHDRYGPVVRLSPNHVAFTDARAWKGIYGSLVGHQSGMTELPKSRFFVKALDDTVTQIINADPTEHTLTRRALASGFSATSLRQQEHILVRYTDHLMSLLHSMCDDGLTPINAERWYNYLSFDITGDLIFGESFGCLDGSAYRPWIALLVEAMKFSTSMTVLALLSLSWLPRLFARAAGALGANPLGPMAAYNDALVRRRMAMPPGRPDLFEGLVRRQKELGFSHDKMCANAFILILGGSETTATTLAGATYKLLTNPGVYERLKGEVRGAFKSAEEITVSSANGLTYMLAVLNEALRMYPPIASNLVREVPRGGVEVAGRFMPGGTLVEVQPWSIHHSKENWHQPWEFRPERWLRDEDGDPAFKDDNLDTMQAFSTGPRNCIGRNLAFAQMRLALARLVYDFDMSLADESDGWFEKQRSYLLWDRAELNVYFKPVRRP
ncbi:isotrichodermin C-15 hydroxylase [Podospora conica]|nr:isotrichodermin C-15 hydroxylase [Schizothecium conicum]